MNLTTEQIQHILAGAPGKNYFSMEPTHYDEHNGDYFILWVGTESGCHSEVWDGSEWVEDGESKHVFPTPLCSYREILSLRQRLTNLETVANASMGVSGQIKNEASKLGFNPASEDDPLSYLIDLAKRANNLELTHADAMTAIKDSESLRQRVEELERQQSEVAARAVYEVSRIIPAHDCSCDSWLLNRANKLMRKGGADE